MEEQQILHLLGTLSIEEKIGQLIQLSGEFFNTGAMAVGPMQKLGIDGNMVQYTGSVLNVLGAAKVIQIQSDYLEKADIKSHCCLWPISYMDIKRYSLFRWRWEAAGTRRW